MSQKKVVRRLKQPRARQQSPQIEKSTGYVVVKGVKGGKGRAKPFFPGDFDVVHFSDAHYVEIKDALGFLGSRPGISAASRLESAIQHAKTLTVSVTSAQETGTAEEILIVIPREARDSQALFAPESDFVLARINEGAISHGQPAKRNKDQDRSDVGGHRLSASIAGRAFVEPLAEGFDAYDVAGVHAQELEQLGRDAARKCLAGYQWQQALGETMDTTRVTQLLGISRQALKSRRSSGSLFAVPGKQSSQYPSWQFAESDGEWTVRPVVLRIVAAFREVLGSDVSPYLIAAWATTPQPELENASPAEWITGGGSEDPVVLAAARAAEAERR
jgi:hypothetical protein